MANVRVEMAAREVKRQSRTLGVSAEHNTGVRIADDSPLLGWLLRLSAHVMNKMRIDKEGKTSEENRSKMEKANGAIWREIWFRKIGEVGVSSSASRMTQGIFVERD